MNNPVVQNSNNRINYINSGIVLIFHIYTNIYIYSYSYYNIYDFYFLIIYIEKSEKKN